MFEAWGRVVYHRRRLVLVIAGLGVIFAAVWDDLAQKHGRDNLRFPREFIWLGGAPGAGKGTNTPFIARTRESARCRAEPCPAQAEDAATRPAAAKCSWVQPMRK